MSSARRSGWSWRSLFSSLGNGGVSNADASSSSGSGTSSNTTASPVPEAQEASGARRGSSPTPLANKPGEEKEGPAESSQSQPPPAPGKNRLSRRKAAPKSSKLKAKAQAQVGDGEPKKKPAPAPTPTPTPTPTQQEMHSKKRKRVSTFERSWSRDDELRILEAMAQHANSHGGALPETSDLFAALGSRLDRRDADKAKLADKVHKLRRRYENARLRGCPTDGDDDARQLFELCEKVWGAPCTVLRRSTRSKMLVEDDVASLKGNTEQSKDVSQQAALKDTTAPAKKRGPTVKAPYVRRELAELSVLYPSLAEEVQAHASDCGELIKAAFEFIGDDEARHFDAGYKKMLMDKLNMKKEHADLTKSLLCTLMGFIN